MDEKHQKKLFEAARLRYVEKWTNPQIAEELGASATQVGRWLKQAEDAGIVKFTFDPPRLQKLETELVKRFASLRDAVVVPTTADLEVQRQILGVAASRYFDDYVDLNRGARVAIGAGTSVQAMIDALPRRKREIEIYPARLIGMGPPLTESSDVMVHISLLWDKSGRAPGTAHYATMLPYEVGEEKADYFKIHAPRSKIQAVFKEMRRVDCLITSVGPIFAPTEAALSADVPARQGLLIRLGDIGLTEKQLHDLDVTGEISYSFFNSQGEGIPELEKFFVLGIEQLRLMAAGYPRRRVVLIAGQKNKLLPLRAAFKGGLCSVLITDDQTAVDLLKD